MANHVLSLDVPTIMTGCVLKVVDTSVYATGLPITCPTLHITLPGYSFSKELSVTENFNLNITACDLGTQTSGCGTTYIDLPDGIWIIKYSLSPSDQLYVEYNHLRITAALKKYEKALCALNLANCDPTAKVKDKLRQLQYIRTLLDAAKAAVEYCHEPMRGMDIYNYAVKLLDKINCVNC
jgi:hypothetical protein